MIRSFRDKETTRLFRREPVKTFGRDVQRVALRKLLLLDPAESLGDLRVPLGNRLQELAGDRKSQHSIRITCGVSVPASRTETPMTLRSPTTTRNRGCNRNN